MRRFALHDHIAEQRDGMHLIKPQVINLLSESRLRVIFLLNRFCTQMDYCQPK